MKNIDNLIELWLSEDIGEGDHTTFSTISYTATGSAKLIVKEKGILAGIEIVKQVIAYFDKDLIVEYYKKDGEEILPGDIAFQLRGKVHSILQIERLILNILQRMSGIATETAMYVEALKGTNTKVLDTRKTTPGIRLLEKEAVRIGGGVNHRIGLYDMILIKDNHIDFAGGIIQAIDRAKSYCREKNLSLKIEIEVRSLNDIKTVLEHGGADRILLDNFSIEMTKTAVEIIGKRVETESSGGITFNTLRQYADCGVDYISVGALSHHIKSLDLSLKADF